MILENKYHGNGKAVYKEAPQEIVHRAQLTTLSLNHPHTTEDGTEPYLAKPVKDLIKHYKENRN